MLLRLALPLVVAVALTAGVWMKWPAHMPVKNSPPKTTETSVMQQSQKKVKASDAILDKDMASIDAEINALESDGVKVEQGFTDQPIPQEEQ